MFTDETLSRWLYQWAASISTACVYMFPQPMPPISSCVRPAYDRTVSRALSR